jgi:hypothetical protein
MLGDAMRHSAVVLLASATVTGLTAVASGQVPANSATKLPPAVVRSFQQTYPRATISATSLVQDEERTAFRVDGLDNGRRLIVLYDPKGALIEMAQQVDEKDLPKPVAAAMHSHPRAIYGTGMKVTRGGSVHYELTLRGTRKTAMVVKPDGTVVSFK